jgi:hypothetical protein
MTNNQPSSLLDLMTLCLRDPCRSNPCLEQDHQLVTLIEPDRVLDEEVELS